MSQAGPESGRWATTPGRKGASVPPSQPHTHGTGPGYADSRIALLMALATGCRVRRVDVGVFTAPKPLRRTENLNPDIPLSVPASQDFRIPEFQFLNRPC